MIKEPSIANIQMPEEQPLKTVESLGSAEEKIDAENLVNNEPKLKEDDLNLEKSLGTNNEKKEIAEEAMRKILECYEILKELTRR